MLLRLAQPLFQAAMKAKEGATPGEEAFEAWYSLRYIATKYLCNHSTLLEPKDRERMVGALKFAHEAAHDLDPALCVAGAKLPEVEYCSCDVAGQLVDLALVLVAAEVERSEAVHAA